jgi:hypothetical protein
MMFNEDLGQNLDQSIEQDDLIAFHLNELPHRKERALRRALQTNPGLQSESAAIATTLRAFPKHEAALPIDNAALERNWQALRTSLAPYTPTVEAHSFFPRWALPALAGAALLTTALVFTLHHDHHSNPITVATIEVPSSNVRPLSLSANSNADTPSSSNFTASTPRSWISKPSSFTPSASLNAELDKTTPTLPPTEFLTSHPQTQVSPAATTNTPAATAESPVSQPSITSPSASPTQLSKLHPPTIHHPHTTDITLAVLGNLTPDRSSTSTSGTGASAATAYYTQQTTPAIGILASFHQQLRPLLGYRITASHSEPSFEYTYATSNSSEGNIISQHLYELSATYVVEGPHHRRLSTSAEAGAGLLAFQPVNAYLTTLPVGNHFRTAAVFGASAELALTKHLALHAGYRALLYKAPSAYITYGTTIPAAPTNLTLSSEPVIGITYRFRATKEE